MSITWEIFLKVIIAHVSVISVKHRASPAAAAAAPPVISSKRRSFCIVSSSVIYCGNKLWTTVAFIEVVRRRLIKGHFEKKMVPLL